MKSLLLILISISCFAQDNTEKVKIDMHGGNYNSLGKNSSFRSKSSSMKMFLDNNSSTNNKDKEGKKK